MGTPAGKCTMCYQSTNSCLNEIANKKEINKLVNVCSKHLFSELVNPNLLLKVNSSENHSTVSFCRNCLDTLLKISNLDTKTAVIEKEFEGYENETTLEVLIKRNKHKREGFKFEKDLKQCKICLTHFREKEKQYDLWKRSLIDKIKSCKDQLLPEIISNDNWANSWSAIVTCQGVPFCYVCLKILIKMCERIEILKGAKKETVDAVEEFTLGILTNRKKLRNELWTTPDNDDSCVFVEIVHCDSRNAVERPEDAEQTVNCNDSPGPSSNFNQQILGLNQDHELCIEIHPNDVLLQNGNEPSADATRDCGGSSGEVHWNAVGDNDLEEILSLADATIAQRNQYDASQNEMIESFQIEGEGIDSVNDIPAVLDNQPLSYTCLHCPKQFSYRRSWVRHVFVCGAKSLPPLAKVPKPFDKPSDKPRFVCHRCKTVFGTKDELCNHFRIKNHPLPPYRSASTSQTPRGTRSLTRGKQIVTRLQSGLFFRDPLTRNVHAAQGSVPVYGGLPRERCVRCRYCLLPFSTQQSLDEHIQVHFEIAKSMRCRLCKEVFNSKRTTKVHFESSVHLMAERRAMRFESFESHSCD